MGAAALRVLVTDTGSEPDVEREVLPGVEIDTLGLLDGDAPAPPDLVRAVERRPAQVVISWLAFDADTLAALARAGVRGIVRTAVGFDSVDLAAARDLGITVCNVPDYGTDEVADHAMALLLWCVRCLRAAPPSAAGPDDWWDWHRFAAIPRLQGSVLALLGFGRIGQAMARRAQAFGFDVRWYDPGVPRGQDKVTRTTRVESLGDLLAGADALSIHCMLDRSTYHLVDAAALALLPAHAVVVNAARGAVIEEGALLDALRGGRLAAAALDVIEHEAPPQGPLYDAYLRGELTNLLLTPHVAWYSQQSAVEIRRKAAAEAGRLLRGEAPWSAVGARDRAS